jgi:xylulose-5-phosphate/fructose-6-phosphate phosphoketolase
MTTKWLPGPLTIEQCELIDAYWRAANFLTVGQIYLRANPLLRRPLESSDIKQRLLGHWGTCPGLNLVYAHMNRIIKIHDADVVFICGPGHGGPGVVANAYMDGGYTDRYPKITRDYDGLCVLFKQFSWPRGIPSHVDPSVPSSMHEGGELGYALLHAYGAVLDNPTLIVCAVVGDGEAETGPCATSWHGTKFVNPARDGAVLPILHLNGAKIGGASLLSRLPAFELEALMVGYGYQPIFVEGDDPAVVHQLMAAALDSAYARIQAIWRAARAEMPETARPRWPMLVLRTPKGWTGPRALDGAIIEGTHRAHQVPAGNASFDPKHLAALEAWLRSYHPEQLFDETGALRPHLAALAPTGARRMSANPHANGGELVVPLKLPAPAEFALPVPTPGSCDAECTRVLGGYLRRVFELNEAAANFRLFCPDEVTSNRLADVYQATGRLVSWDARAGDETFDSKHGRVMEILSEHTCSGWLEGYTLTGRHGLFATYEAFAQVVDSMINQHAKWLKATAEIGWRRPYPSYNLLLTSHVWRQDHNGYTHQAPGALCNLATKKGSIANIYLPPDANCLLLVAAGCLGSMHKINAIVAGKHSMPQWLDMPTAEAHCARGVSEWLWASIAPAGAPVGAAPDVVLACSGDVPTLEAVAAAKWLRMHAAHINLRFVNVVELMRLRAPSWHPRGLDDGEFVALFGERTPVVFAFHGYPQLLSSLLHERPAPGRFSVHGYIEEGSTTTPFDMTVVNELSRFHLAIDVLERTRALGEEHHAELIVELRDKLVQHAAHVWDEGVDMPEVVDFKWHGHEGKVSRSRAPAVSRTFAVRSSPLTRIVVPRVIARRSTDAIALAARVPFFPVLFTGILDTCPFRPPTV